MRPSIALQLHQDAVREAASHFRAANPRVFGSVVHGPDEEGSDLALLVDALPGATLFDLGGYVAARLARAGVVHVEDLGLCTYADPARFFSYRRATHRAEADYGRHVTAIALID